jgi:hypothetical protein
MVNDVYIPIQHIATTSVAWTVRNQLAVVFDRVRRDVELSTHLTRPSASATAELNLNLNLNLNTTLSPPLKSSASGTTNMNSGPSLLSSTTTTTTTTTTAAAVTATAATTLSTLPRGTVRIYIPNDIPRSGMRTGFSLFGHDPHIVEFLARNYRIRGAIAELCAHNAQVHTHTLTQLFSSDHQSPLKQSLSSINSFPLALTYTHVLIHSCDVRVLFFGGW